MVISDCKMCHKKELDLLDLKNEVLKSEIEKRNIEKNLKDL